MSLKRIAITGSSGNYGRRTIRELRHRYPNAQILGLDLHESTTDVPDEFISCDVLSDKLHDHLKHFSPDTIIHLAFVVNPMRDEDRMKRINVEGTENVFNAAADIQPARLLISSSATAYGGWPDNPVPMSEDWQLRARTEYRYAHDKVTVEEMLEQFSQSNPNIAVSWTRPCIIYGTEIKNFLTDFITKGPLIVLPGGNNTELQFVHEDDVAGATVTILEQNARGPFNIAPGDWITLRDLAALGRRRIIRVPFPVCKTITRIWWAMRLPLFRFPAGLWYFIRYPWVISPKRLESELQFQFRYSTLDTTKLMFYDAGRIAEEPVVPPRESFTDPK